MSRTILIVMAMVAAVGASAVVGQGSEPRMGNIGSIMQLETSTYSNVVARKFAETESCTINLLAVKGEVPAHYHAKHEETIVVVQGEGVFTLAGKQRIIQPGDVIFIPRGTIHAFVPTSRYVLVVSTFTPKFDGKDRIFVGG